MSIAPPPIKLYENPGPLALWREVMHLYAELAGSEESRMVFARVMADARRVADPLLCQACSTPTVNMAEGTLVHLVCPNCGARPVEARQLSQPE